MQPEAIGLIAPIESRADIIINFCRKYYAQAVYRVIFEYLDNFIIAVIPKEGIRIDPR